MNRVEPCTIVELFTIKNGKRGRFDSGSGTLCHERGRKDRKTEDDLMDLLETSPDTSRVHDPWSSTSNSDYRPYHLTERVIF